MRGYNAVNIKTTTQETHTLDTVSFADLKGVYTDFLRRFSGRSPKQDMPLPPPSRRKPSHWRWKAMI